MIKSIIVVIGLTFWSFGAFSQEPASIDLIATDSTWGKEHFTFPLRFAQKIDFKGVEEAVFPAGWGDVESPAFWSYAFAWQVEANGALTENVMEVNLQYYFDGLLGLDHDRKVELPVKASTSLVVRTGDATGTTHYAGKIKTFDTRFTQKPMTLHVIADQYFCQKERKTFVLFRFSPKGFDAEIWSRLKILELQKHLCPQQMRKF
ncbi:MAG: hypothetical protein HEP71_26610 [Roseivirga sp.]|nr:hypothetical protein [Roseivirga sp.]